MTDQNQQPQRPYYDDEISLVDLATTFIRRRRVFYGVFVLVMVIAVAFALLRSQAASVSYTTTLQLSTLPVLDESERKLESSGELQQGRVPTLIAKIESHWLPLARQKYAEHQGSWPGGVNVDVIEDTELLTLTTSASNLAETQVREAHQLVAGLVVAAQNERLAQRVGLLEQQIETMNEILDTHSPESLVAAQAIETRTELQQKVATGEPAAVLSLASASTITDSGPSTKLILALAIVLGLMLGIFAAFMAEFASQVRQAMKEKA